MPNVLKKFGHALKIGYSIVTQLEAAGVPLPGKVKGVPIIVIQQATEAFVKKVKDAHDANQPTQSE